MTQLGNLSATIISGDAMLSEDGQTLSLSDIVALVETIGQQTIPGFECTCESVESLLLLQETRTEEVQRIHREKMEELGIE